MRSSVLLAISALLAACTCSLQEDAQRDKDELTISLLIYKFSLDWCALKHPWESYTDDCIVDWDGIKINGRQEMMAVVDELKQQNYSCFTLYNITGIDIQGNKAFVNLTESQYNTMDADTQNPGLGAGDEGSGVEGSGVEGSGDEGSGVEGSGVEGSGDEGSGDEGSSDDVLMDWEKKNETTIDGTLTMVRVEDKWKISYAFARKRNSGEESSGNRVPVPKSDGLSKPDQKPGLMEAVLFTVEFKETYVVKSNVVENGSKE